MWKSGHNLWFPWGKKKKKISRKVKGGKERSHFWCVGFGVGGAEERRETHIWQVDEWRPSWWNGDPTMSLKSGHVRVLWCALPVKVENCTHDTSFTTTWRNVFKSVSLNNSWPSLLDLIFYVTWCLLGTKKRREIYFFSFLIIASDWAKTKWNRSQWFYTQKGFIDLCRFTLTFLTSMRVM